MIDSAKHKVDARDQEVLMEKGLGEFGDEFIYIPIKSKQVKTGIFFRQTESDEEDEKSDQCESEDSHDEPAYHDDWRTKIETIVNFLYNKDDAPWINNHPISTDPWVKLHNEIIQYYEYYGPNEEQDKLGRNFFFTVRSIIETYNPSFKVELYGAWGLRVYSKLSDLDVSVVLPLNPKRKKHVRNVHLIDLQEEEIKYIQEEISEIYLKFMGCKSFSAVKYFEKNTIPSLKVVDKESSLTMIIQFNKVERISSFPIIKKFMIIHPEFKFLVLILKELLKSRELNNIKNGGMPSYVLMLLIISYLLETKKEGVNRDLLLSEHLLNFFSLYGIRFNYKMLGISIRSGGFYFSREDRGWSDSSDLSLISLSNSNVSISVENPQDPSVDIGKSIKQMKQIQIAFAYAFDSIKYNSKQSKSLLKWFLLKNPVIKKEED